MAEVGLKAELRDGTGKGVARKLRAQGKIPAVIYGRGMEPISLAVESRALQHTLSTDAGLNVLIDLQVEGDRHLTLARAVEKDPVRGNYIHVDFLKISRDVKITVDVPIHVEGEAPGVKEGGVLEHHLWQLHVECLPTDVPERIHVDVGALALGESVHVRDVEAPGCTILTPEDEIIVACVVPQALKVEAELEEAPAEGEAAEGAAAPAEGEASASAESSSE